MKVSDVSMADLIEAIGQAIVPIIYEGVEEGTPAYIIRRRAYLNAEIIGRIAAVLHSGNHIDPNIIERIDFFTTYMREAYSESMDEFLGPEGGMAEYMANVRKSD